MEAARHGMSETLSQIGGLLPKGRVREEFEHRARSLLKKADDATLAQRRLEQAKRAERPRPANGLSDADRQRLAPCRRGRYVFGCRLG